MKKLIGLFLLGVLLAAGPIAAQKHGRSHSSGRSHSRSYSSKPHKPKSERSHGRRIKRDPMQKAAFERQHPCPSTGKSHGKCHGWVIDHVKALACGGPDKPSNMQWQTVADAKAKDKWERKECGK